MSGCHQCIFICDNFKKIIVHIVTNVYEKINMLVVVT